MIEQSGPQKSLKDAKALLVDVGAYEDMARWLPGWRS